MMRILDYYHSFLPKREDCHSLERSSIFIRQLFQCFHKCRYKVIVFEYSILYLCNLSNVCKKCQASVKRHLTSNCYFAIFCVGREFRVNTNLIELLALHSQSAERDGKGSRYRERGMSGDKLDNWETRMKESKKNRK